jgi:hypothetical protein
MLLRDVRTCPNLNVPIIAAAGNGHFAIVEALLMRPDLDIHARNGLGLNALEVAILGGRYRVVARLLDTGRFEPDLGFALRAGLRGRGAVRVFAALEAYVRGRRTARGDASGDRAAQAWIFRP